MVGFYLNPMPSSSSLSLRPIGFHSPQIRQRYTFILSSPYPYPYPLPHGERIEVGIWSNSLETFFAHTALRANPVLWQILKGCARAYLILRVAFLRIIDVSTDRATIFCHGFTPMRLFSLGSHQSAILGLNGGSNPG